MRNMVKLDRNLCFLLTFLLFTFVTSLYGQPDTLSPLLKSLNPKERVEVLDRLAATFMKDSLELSLYYQLQAYKASLSQNDFSLSLTQAERVADTYTQLGQYSKGIEYYNTALGFARRINSKKDLNRIYRFIGNVYYYMGEYDKSLASHLESLEIAQELNFEPGIASSYNNIGLIHMQAGNYEVALENYQKAEKLFAKYSNSLNQGLALLNIGNIYYFRKDFITAKGYYEKALDIFSGLNDSSNIALASQNLSVIYEELQDYENALKYAQRAYHLYLESNNTWGLANITKNIAYFFIARDDISEAEFFAQKCLQYSEQTNSLHLLGNAYNLGVKVFELKEEFNNAFKYLKLQNQVVDSIYKMDTDRKLAELESKLLLEKKNKEHKLLELLFIISSFLAVIIVLIILINYRIKVKANIQLREMNKKINEQNQELAAINATKDKFFSIIAHDLKNPLSAFIGFMEVFQMRLAEMPVEEQQHNLKQLTLLAENMLDLLENLLKWGRAQAGSLDFIPEKIPLRELVNNSISVVSFNAIGKSIEIENLVDESIVIVGDKNMLSTVTRNLLSNAVKFSHIGGKISVKAERSDGFTSLLVYDFGIGVSSEDQQMLFKIDSKFRSKGTADESGTGLGLILCKEFINLHSGKMIVRSEVDKGSVFGFKLKDEV